MRKIKFRGKSNGENFKDGMLVFGGIKIDKSRDEYYITTHSNNNMDISVSVHTNSIGQYTGLKDKNNVDIYEGDIVDIKDMSERSTGYGKTVYISQVVFHAGCFCVIVPALHPSSFTSMPLYHFDETWSVEVVGNVHDNHELLKQLLKIKTNEKQSNNRNRPR